MALSNKQQVFIENYLTCWNATEAARRAGYAYPNVEGPKNLVNPSISVYIANRIASLKMSADETILRLANMARSNIADFAHIQSDSDLAELGDKAQVIKKFKRKVTYDKNENRYEEIELELYPADVNLERLAKHHKLLGTETGTSDSPFIIKIIHDDTGDGTPSAST
jgi:phage terminase small subunit